MDLELHFTPWFRANEDRYINLTKLTDITFYEDDPNGVPYAVCRLESGAQCRIAGDELAVLRLILDDCHSANWLNARIYKKGIEYEKAVMQEKEEELERAKKGVQRSPDIPF